MQSFTKIPATIVTGFLGAGKTSLIRHVLAHAQGKRLALIINEFGDIGVDGEILKGCGVESCREDAIIELANGCICCTVADDFLPAIEKLLQLDPTPQHIIIETSGLALPKPLVKAFDWPAIRSRLTVDGVIAVVDAAAVNAGRFADDPAKLLEQRRADTAIEHDNPLEEVYEDQLLCADLVILNKTDLVGEGECGRLINEITALIPRAVKIVASAHGKIDPKILLGLDAMAEDDLAARPSHHDLEGEHDHDDFESFIFDMPAINTPGELERKFNSVTAQHDILRLKGFIDVRGKPMRLLVQGVGTRLQHTFDRPWKKDEERLGRLVIIGQKGLDIASIKSILNS